MASQDKYWWRDHFIDPCLENRDTAGTARAAALAHSNYLPAMTGDNFEDFCRGSGHGDVPGLYFARVSSSLSQQVLQWQQQQQQEAAAAAASDAWWHQQQQQQQQQQ